MVVFFLQWDTVVWIGARRRHGDTVVVFGGVGGDLSHRRVGVVVVVMVTVPLKSRQRLAVESGDAVTMHRYRVDR